jgi:hypothetical protein
MELLSEGHCVDRGTAGLLPLSIAIIIEDAHSHNRTAVTVAPRLKPRTLFRILLTPIGI